MLMDAAFLDEAMDEPNAMAACTDWLVAMKLLMGHNLQGETETCCIFAVSRATDY